MGPDNGKEARGRRISFRRREEEGVYQWHAEGLTTTS